MEQSDIELILQDRGRLIEWCRQIDRRRNLADLGNDRVTSKRRFYAQRLRRA